MTRDIGLQPRQVQFRLDFRDAVGLLTKRLGERTRRFAEELSAWIARCGLRIAEIFLLSLVLQAGMLPMMARDFHRIALLGPIANSFAVPLTGVLVPLGFLSLALSFVVPRAAGLLAHHLGWLVTIQGRMISWIAAIPHGSYRIPGPPPWLINVFFVTAVVAVVALRGTRFRPWMNTSIVLCLATAGVLIATYPFAVSINRNRLEVTVLDVALGDSILVVSPRGSTLLIDGGGAFEGFRGRPEHLGPDPGEEAVSTYLWWRGFQKIDAVALTHAHQDHVGGLTAILQNFRVSRLILGRETAGPAFTRLKQVAERLHVPVEHQHQGQSFLWDGVQVDFLWPEISPEEIAPQAKNNDSLVIRLRYKDRTILLPGDAEKQVEYAMLAENDLGFLHADVLKVGHHGSKNSTMPEFLAAIAPHISIISAGEENPYGHPSPELLERLESSGSRILRTDRNGEVQILTDGHDLRVGCFEGCRGTLGAELSAQAPDQQQSEKQ